MSWLSDRVGGAENVLPTALVAGGTMLGGPIGGGLVAGGLGMLGQNSANATNVTLAGNATQTNLQSAREQMQFQEQMSSSAYQRAMADMSKAGLNPMLAFSQGGASSPSGASGSAVAGHVENSVGAGISSALESRRLSKELQQAESQTSLNEAATATQRAQARLNNANARVAGKNEEAIAARLPAIKAGAANEAERAQFDKKFIEADSIGDRIGRFLGIVNSAKDVVTPKVRIDRGGRTEKNTTIDGNTGEILHESTRRLP